MLKNLNAAIEYIEANLLAEEIDVDKAAALACINSDSFMRFFSYMTGMTLNEYIRRRKLSAAADDVRNRNDRIIDIAVKFGYESADAFSRASVSTPALRGTFSEGVCEKWQKKRI